MYAHRRIDTIDSFYAAFVYICSLRVLNARLECKGGGIPTNVRPRGRLKGDPTPDSPWSVSRNMFPDGNSDSDIQRHRWMLIMTLVRWHLTFSCWQRPSCDSSHQHSDIYCWSSSHDRNPALINYPNKRMHKYKRYRNHSEWEMLHDAWAAAVARIPAHPRMPLLSSQNRWVEDTPLKEHLRDSLLKRESE